jgi:glycogen debranching enzyme
MARGIHMTADAPKGAGPYYYTGYATSIFSIEYFFDAIMLWHFGNTSLAENTLRILLHGRHSEDGFVPRKVVTNPLEVQGDPFYTFEMGEHCQPVLFQCALMVSRQKGSAAWITPELYEAMKAYLVHWQKYWDRDGNGLCEWASAPHGCSDTAFDRAGIWRSYFCEGVDLNCQRHLEYRAAEKLAIALGQPKDAAHFAAEAARIADLVRTVLWDEQDGFFYDRDIRTGGKVNVKHCHCFHVLESGIATKEQADRIVREHLLNPKEFWTAYPIASYALTEPAYTQRHRPPQGENVIYYLPEGHCNWRGGMWPHTAYSCAHGLATYGYIDEARHIAR